MATDDRTRNDVERRDVVGACLAMRAAMLLLYAIGFTGCGARTGLRVDDAGDAGEVSDALDGRVPECRADRDCDDRVPCTRDRCDAAAGRCVHAPDDARCDDRRYCNGVERCLATGCAAGEPVRCDDGVGCTVDACDEGMRRCTSTPDDGRCPISHRCDPARACVARVLANTSTDLFEVELPSGALRSLGPVAPFTDVALHPDRTLYAVTSRGELWRLDASTRRGTYLSATGQPLTALDATPDGTVYAAGSAGLFRVEPRTGATRFVASFPPGLEASGDLAVYEGRLLASARADPSSLDTLVEFDLATGRSRVLGGLGYRCVWALAAFGSTLYGLTCEGVVLRVGASNGAATVLTRADAVFYGATAR